jgi:hypothetical protein
MACVNLPASFPLKDERYEWKENPRPHAHALCMFRDSILWASGR